MKNRNLLAVLAGCLLTLLLACNTKKAEPSGTAIDQGEFKSEAAVDKEQIKKLIQAKEDSFASLYNNGEMRNIGYYADDATSFFQNRPPLVGKQAIIEFLKNDVISNSDRISFETREIFVSNDGNQVVEVGAFRVVDSVNHPINTGNYMTLFEKRNGKYVAVRDMSASDGQAQ